MKENIGDLVVHKVNKRYEMFLGKLKERFGDTNPFQKEPMDVRKLYFNYRQLMPDQIHQLMQKHSVQKVTDFINDMESMKLDKRRRL